MSSRVIDRPCRCCFLFFHSPRRDAGKWWTIRGEAAPYPASGPGVEGPVALILGSSAGYGLGRRSPGSGGPESLSLRVDEKQCDVVVLWRGLLGVTNEGVGEGIHGVVLCSG